MFKMKTMLKVQSKIDFKVMLKLQLRLIMKRETCRGSLNVVPWPPVVRGSVAKAQPRRYLVRGQVYKTRLGLDDSPRTVDTHTHLCVLFHWMFHLCLSSHGPSLRPPGCHPPLQYQLTLLTSLTLLLAYGQTASRCSPSSLLGYMMMSSDPRVYGA